MNKTFQGISSFALLLFILVNLITVKATATSSVPAGIFTNEASSAITKSLYLPSQLPNGKTVSYESSRPDVIAIDEANCRGVVRRQDTDTEVNITAEFSDGTSQTYPFVVLGRSKYPYVSENFYYPDDVGTLTPVAVNPDEGKNRGFSVAPTLLSSYKVSIENNPANTEDCALKLNRFTKDAYSGYSNTDYLFDEKPYGPVTFKARFRFDELDLTAANSWRSLYFYSESKNAIMVRIDFFQSGALNLRNTNESGTLGVFVNNLSYDSVNRVVDWFDLTVSFDFEAGTYTTQFNTQTPVTKQLINNSYTTNDSLSFFRITHRTDATNAVMYMDDLSVTGTAPLPAALVPPVKAQYNTNGSLFVRTPFNDGQDLFTLFKGLSNPGLLENDVADLNASYLINKSDSTWNTSTRLAGGGDECTPFQINGVYIGGHHGHTAGVLLTTTEEHGKDASDVGSVWQDSQGNHWNMLRVLSPTQLLFISDNQGTLSGYRFLESPTGESLTHAGNETDNSAAIHQEPITDFTLTTKKQIYRACKLLNRSVWMIDSTGERTEIQPGSDAVSAEAIEISEHYQIINPATIADGLRQNRPAGGYTDNPDLAVGTPMIDVNLTYRIEGDGTVLTIMDHEILMDLNSVTYGGVQSTPRDNLYGGGIYKYIPKTKPLRATSYNEETKTNGPIQDFIFTTPWNCSGNIRPLGGHLSSNYWENPDSPPDREIEYYRDSSTQKDKVAFVTGYLPVEDGVETVRKNRVAGSAYYVYRSNKSYPYFAYNTAMKAGETIKGVAYKKFEPITQNDKTYSSVYSIPYNDSVYYYIDYHNTGSDTLYMPESFSVTGLEQSDNVEMAINNNKITFSADCDTSGDYGYLVLRADHASTVRIKNGVYDAETGLLNFSLENSGAQSKNATVIGTSYAADNRLLECVILEDLELSGQTSTPESMEFFNGNTAEIRLFIVNSLHDLQPLGGRYLPKIEN